MNRNEFLRRLEVLLSDISKEEREEALQYYRDYFEDAGAEHEADVIRELGSPEKVAETIKADLTRDAYTEDAAQSFPAQTGTTQNTQSAPKSSNGLKVLLIVLIVLVGAPIILPIGFVLVLAVIGIVIAAFSFFAGLVLGALAIICAGLVIIAVGIPLLVAALPAGLLSIGGGLVVLVVGLIGTVVTVKLCIVMYPAMFRIMVNICRWPFYHKKKANV